MKKRVLTLFLALALCMGLAVPAFAATTAPLGGSLSAESTEPSEPADPETTEPADPEPTEPAESTEPTDPEPTEPADPEPTESTEPADPEPTEPADPEPADPTVPEFDDVPDWCKTQAQWAVAQGITNGASANKFVPERECTHIEILTFLARAAGATKAGVSAWDVEQEQVKEWAKEKGMIDDAFQPNALCTRADAVTYIWQAKDKPEATETASFPDVSEDASYIDAVNWAAEKGVTGGDGEGNFAPDRVCQRSEIVVFLYRAYN